MVTKEPIAKAVHSKMTLPTTKTEVIEVNVITAGNLGIKRQTVVSVREILSKRIKKMQPSLQRGKLRMIANQNRRVRRKV